MSTRKMRMGLGFLLGAVTGYVAAQQAWALHALVRINPMRTLTSSPKERHSRTPVVHLGEIETATYVKTHVIEGGIERIIYRPHTPAFATPLLFQHGMWHGAWCWELWQAAFAELGWESHAFSLPGHGRSPERRPIARCTLDYYLRFLNAEVERLPVRPIVIGHSMGGALVQWYLKYTADDLPAAVLAAPWTAHSLIADGLGGLITYDPLGIALMMKTWDATPLIRRTPNSAARGLIGPEAAIPLETLWDKLGPESALVLYQHNPPFWAPPLSVHTPLLWVAGEDDPLLREPAQRRSAEWYDAEYIIAAGARHNVMMAHNYTDTAARIHTWLQRQGIS